jgi:hypothetical protein
LPSGVNAGLYFLKNDPSFNHWTIVVSHEQNGKWSTPEVAPFSGQFSDADPFLTLDGERFFFISTRPLNGKAKEDTDIWMMKRNGPGAAATWSEPQHLAAVEQRCQRMVSNGKQGRKSLFRFGAAGRQREVGGAEVTSDGFGCRARGFPERSRPVPRVPSNHPGA